MRSPDRLDNGGDGAAGPAAALEVVRVFLGLGLTSFGGPIAHLGYFRQAFVERRGWLSEASRNLFGRRPRLAFDEARTFA